MEDGDGNVSRVNADDKAFNSWMTEVFWGSDMDEIIEEMFTHMKMQIENPALVNSRFVFDQVLFLDISFHQLNLIRGSTYLPLPGWISHKKAIKPRKASHL